MTPTLEERAKVVVEDVLKVLGSSDFRREEMHLPVLEHLRAENERLRWLLNQILTHLPSNRDWLDPDVEREARDTLANTPGGEGMG